MTIGRAKRQNSKLLHDCIRAEIKAGRRDDTIAKLIGDQVTIKDLISVFRWRNRHPIPKTRRYY